MKNLFLIFAMVPMLAIGQISNWRTNPPQQQSTPQPQRSTPSTQPSTPQRNDVSSWRNTPQPSTPQYGNTPQPNRRNLNYRYDNQLYRYNNQFYRYNDFGWYYPSNYYWYDPYGFRNRGQVYIYESGKSDTIRTTPTRFSIGIQKSKDMLGAWTTIGNKGYFIIDYLTTSQIDNITKYTLGSDYFSNKSLSDVDFPIISSNVIKRNIFYLGGGKMINNKTGLHVMIGFGNDDKIYRGRDGIGYITFPNKETFTTVKLGLIRHYNKVSGKLDYDVNKKYLSLGLGLNF